MSSSVDCTFTSLYVNWNPHLVAAVVDLLPRLATSSKTNGASPSTGPIDHETDSNQIVDTDKVNGLLETNETSSSSPLLEENGEGKGMNEQGEGAGEEDMQMVEYRLKASASMKRLTISLNMASSNNQSVQLGQVSSSSSTSVPVQRLFLVAMARARTDMLVGRPLHASSEGPTSTNKPTAAAVSGIVMNGSLQRLEVWSEHGKNRRLLKQRKFSKVPSSFDSTSDTCGLNNSDDPSPPPPPPPLSPSEYLSSPSVAAPLPNTPTSPEYSKRPIQLKKGISRRVSAVETSDHDWLTFTYARPYRGIKGGVSMGTATMNFRPIQVVFVNCQALQLMNYAYHGVTGALFKKAATLASATLDRLGATLSTTITADRPRVVVPLALNDSPALVVDFEKVVMKHRFMQGRLVMEGELDAQGATFATLKSGLRIEHRNLKPKPNIQITALFEPGPLGLKFSSNKSMNNSNLLNYAMVSGLQPGGSGELQGIRLKDRVLSVGNRECGE